MLGKHSYSMRFRHLTQESLDKKVDKAAKADEKIVVRTQLLQSKEWQEHVAEHHSTGPKPQLVAVTTTEDSNLFKKAEEKKEEKEEQVKPQHTINHSQLSSSPQSGYVSSNPGNPQRNPGDEYFGAGSARLQAISGQCSCGAEITIGTEPYGLQTPEQRLRSGYATPLERERISSQQQQQPLYSTAAGQAGSGQEQQRQIYTTGQQTSSSQAEQRRRKTTAL